MKRLLFLCCCLLPLCAAAKPITISGRVSSAADNSPLAGVSVVVKNQQVVSTDTLGRYSITVDEQATLCFALVGFDKQEIPVKGRTRIDVKMKKSVQKITTSVEFSEFDSNTSGVVVMAYGMSPRSGHTGSTRIGGVSSTGGWFPGGEAYAHFNENRFRAAANEPLSTFGLESDGAAYANCRRKIIAGELPAADAVRIEEFVNYFPYDYAPPQGREPLALTADAAPCPWNKEHRLVRIALRAAEVDAKQIPASNFVYLIDVSGSMRGRMPLVKASIKMLTDNLRSEDRVSVVTYANDVKEVLAAVSGSDRRRIKDAVDALVAAGGTAGGAGLQLAYEVAAKNFIKGGNNRVILCTDGDFNIGDSSDEAIEAQIERLRKESGVQLSVLGYGMGNYKEKKMQILAEKGDGNFSYINDMAEASKVLFHEFGSTVWAVARDVKLQVEFNPATVTSYRLVGYESRLLAKEDFNDDQKDAGEIGAGRCVTALYEIIPAGSKEHAPGTVDELKYQTEKRRTAASASGELLTAKVRYKLPDTDKSALIERPLTDNGAQTLTGDFAFAAAVAMYGQLLKGSDFRGDATYDAVIELATQGFGRDPGGYRAVFIDLVRTTKHLK